MTDEYDRIRIRDLQTENAQLRAALTQRDESLAALAAAIQGREVAPGSVADADIGSLCLAAIVAREPLLASDAPSTVRTAGPKRPEYEPKDDHQRLAYFIEECGEVLVPLATRIGKVLAAAGKLLRWGPQSYNPEIPPDERETNAEWLLREIGDLQAAVDRARPMLHRAVAGRAAERLMRRIGDDHEPGAAWAPASVADANGSVGASATSELDSRVGGGGGGSSSTSNSATHPPETERIGMAGMAVPVDLLPALRKLSVHECVNIVALMGRNIELARDDERHVTLGRIAAFAEEFIAEHYPGPEGSMGVALGVASIRRIVTEIIRPDGPLHVALPPTATPADETDCYLIFESQTFGDLALWWRPNANGYTVDLEQAGRYTLAQASRKRATDIPVHVDIVRRHHRKVMSRELLLDLISQTRDATATEGT